MAKISTSDFRNGLNILVDGEIYTIVEFQHVKPGKGPAFVRTKLKGVENEKNIDKTFRSGENVESIRVEHQPYQFLYADGDMFFFMHQETYEQIPLERSRVENEKFVTDGMICTLVIDVDNDNVLYAVPPDQIEAEVIDTDPGVKGDTAQGGSKPATITGGAVVQVPLFISKGENIRVDTRTGDYLERAKSK
ncbi:elongation factor P [Rhodohalobacter mucosus]|uniref:Elongation factor P n=1 Tax=Rhodohalobacter mucosus TaxID=2079485 RepID=A0A316TR81_9BACT|nr:elongation factor P [Rhodohalobacter mucosus]PWN07113.1 elongation factor P [Rhodohalobacter mucosus]